MLLKTSKSIELSYFVWYTFVIYKMANKHTLEKYVVDFLILFN